jgi:hypothetical protein
MPEESRVGKAKAKHETVDMLVDTIEHEHQQAYSTAVEKHLKNDEGQVDYGRLKETGIQRKFAESMAEHYVEKAREKFGISKDKRLSDEEKSMLLTAYAGITKEELGSIIKQRKHRFTHNVFRNIIGDNERGLKANIRNRLLGSAYEQLEEEDKPEIIKSMGKEAELDPSKMTLEQAVSLLQTYHNNSGVLPPDAYEGEIYHKKKQRER